MFVRLTIADVKEGEINNALEYVKNTVIPSYDGISGLLGIAACKTNDGRFMAWSTILPRIQFFTRTYIQIVTPTLILVHLTLCRGT